MKKVNPWIYWTPRIVSLLFLCFLALFSLDVFDSCSNFLNCSLALFMHNIPVIILAILLYFAWKKEIVGAVTFASAGLLYIILTSFRVPWYLVLSWSLIISLPCFIIAYLYYLNWKKKAK